MSRLVAGDHWRHFIAEAPDLELTVIAGQDNLIPMDHLIQGAVSFEGVSPIPTDPQPSCQRGWLYTPVLIAQPKFGSVDFGPYRRELLYKTRGRFEGADCFNYYLTNGQQRSTIGRVDLNVIRGHDIDVTITQDPSVPNVFKFSGVPVIASELFNPTFTSLMWEYERWYVDSNNYVRSQWTVFGMSRYYVQYDWSAKRHVFRLKEDGFGPYAMSFQNLSVMGFEKYLDPKTNQPFIAPDRFPNVRLVARFCRSYQYPGVPDTNDYLENIIDFDVRYRTPWHKSGLIQHVEP